MNFHLLLSSLKNDLPCHYYSTHFLQTKVIHSDYPREWVDFYTRHHYADIDYALVESRETPFPLYWSKNISHRLSQQQRDVFNAARAFNIHSGLSMKNSAHQSIVTLSSHYKELSLSDYDDLCAGLIFVNYVSLIHPSSESVSHSDFRCLFHKFRKERDKINQHHHATLFQALHHLQISRLYLNKILFSYEKESATKYMAEGASLIDKFIEKSFQFIKNK